MLKRFPDNMLEDARLKREQMVEQIAELDDELLLKFLEGESISNDELKAGLRRAVIANTAAPVFCGSSLKNKGVQPVIDAVVDYLPSPLDIPAVHGTKPNDEEEVVERPPSDEAPLAALVFKIVTDPYVGRLAYFRVYSGVLKSGSTVYNPVKGKRERIGRVLRMYADRREDVDEIYAGEIAAILGLKESFHRRYAVCLERSDCPGEHHLP